MLASSMLNFENKTYSRIPMKENSTFPKYDSAYMRRRGQRWDLRVSTNRDVDLYGNIHDCCCSFSAGVRVFLA